MQTFGCFLRTARQSIDSRSAELARKLDISAAYLNDIEKVKGQPDERYFVRLVRSFAIGGCRSFFELAGRSKKKLPPT